jgi:hypothetical protein
MAHGARCSVGPEEGIIHPMLLELSRGAADFHVLMLLCLFEPHVLAVMALGVGAGDLSCPIPCGQHYDQQMTFIQYESYCTHSFGLG